MWTLDTRAIWPVLKKISPEWAGHFFQGTCFSRTFRPSDAFLKRKDILSRGKERRVANETASRPFATLRVWPFFGKFQRACLLSYSPVSRNWLRLLFTGSRHNCENFTRHGSESGSAEFDFIPLKTYSLDQSGSVRYTTWKLDTCVSFTQNATGVSLDSRPDRLV